VLLYAAPLSPQVPDPDQEDSVFAQLQGLFAQLALSKATFASPNAFWAAFKDYDGTPIDVREHQDAYEFFTRLQVSRHESVNVTPPKACTLRCLCS
jgi:ubiquitin carboxyl-terminal hydrolase 9/24